MKLLLLFVSCALASFCTNAVYEYSYRQSYGDYVYPPLSYAIKTNHIVIVINPSTGLLFTKNVADIVPGDLVQTHSGHLTVVKNVSLTTIEYPNMFYRRNTAGRNGYTEVNLAIMPEYTKIAFTDITPTVLNRTYEYVNDNGTNILEFGIYNYTDKINYDLYPAGGSIYYSLNGVDLMNMAVIVNYFHANGIEEYSCNGYKYINVTASISASCNAVNITTESGYIIVNDLLYRA